MKNRKGTAWWYVFTKGSPSWHHLPNLSTPISPAPQSLSPPLRLSEITIRTSVPEVEFCHLDFIEMAPCSVEAFEHLFTTLWNPSMLFPAETDHSPSWLSRISFCNYITTYLSVLLSKDLWAISHLGLSWVMFLWIFSELWMVSENILRTPVYPFLLDLHIGLQLCFVVVFIF